MKYKHTLGSWIPTLARKRFSCSKEAIFDGGYGVKIDSARNMPTFVLVLKPAVNNGKTGYLRRVHPINEVLELMTISAR
jgi:hypothetical protein